MADSAGFGAFSQRELRSIAKVFQVMGDEAVEESRKVAYDISNLAKNEIKSAGYARTKGNKAVKRIVDGASVSRTSKTGRLSYGFAGQRFSGGGTTQRLWAGYEFGSKVRSRKDGTVRRFNQFPEYSGRYGSGSRGWFIYPTLRKIQPQLTQKYLAAINKVVKDWSKSG